MNVKTFTVTPDLYSSKGKRFANFLIDYIMQIILGFIFGIIIALISELTENYVLYDIVVESESRLSDYIYGFFILLIYYTLIETFTKGRSIGKYITKTAVVLKDGSKPKIDEILIRTLCRFIPFEAFSFLGDLGKGWHDTLSKTYVVDVDKLEAKKNSITEIDQIGQLENTK